jgi:hypothetical protein
MAKAPSLSMTSSVAISQGLTGDFRERLMITPRILCRVGNASACSILASSVMVDLDMWLLLAFGFR